MSELTITTAGSSQTAKPGFDKKKADIIYVTPTVIAGTTHVDDVMFNATEIPNAVSHRGGVAKLIGIGCIDQDAEKHDYDLVFMQKQQNLGTAGSGANVSDDDLMAAKPLGAIDCDWTATQVNVASVQGLNYFANQNRNGAAQQLPMLIKADVNSTSIYFSAIAKEEMDYAATDDLTFIFHIEYL